MNNLETVVLQSISSIAVALVGLLAAVAISYLNKMTKKLDNEILRINDESTQDYCNRVLNAVDGALNLAVDQVESSTVKVLKEVAKDGKLTSADKKIVRNEAKDLAENILGCKFEELLVGIVGDTEKYVNSKIASLVIEKKTGDSSSNTMIKSHKKLNS